MLCIKLEKVNEFKKALKNKKINIADLINMTSEERTKLLSKFAGDNAKDVNTLFEQKLILKNRLQGIKNWASKIGEIGRYDPAKKANLDKLMNEYKARQQERMFNPQENEAFLSDLVEEKFGTRISKEEAKNVFDLTAKAEELKQNFDGKEWTSEEDRFTYGASKVTLENYIEDLKTGNFSLKNLSKERISQFKQTWATNKPKAVTDLLTDSIKAISDNSISLVASVDNSFLGRQGLKTLMTHPSVWWSGAKNSFGDFAKTLGGKETMDALNADIYSRPNFINGNYETAKIFATFEEQFPSLLPERVPVLGKVFKASDVAFRGSALRMRTGLFDLLTKQMEENGVDITDPYQLKSIGTVINSLTARGQWGKRGEMGGVRLVLWAPRMIKGNIDVLTAHTGQDISSFARKQAGINLLKIITETALFMMIANALRPKSIEYDPRSSDFGKLKIGDTRFDFTGGAGSLVTLAARLITNSTKNPTTGEIKQYGSGFGQASRFDILIDFLSNKTTPFARRIVDRLRGRTYEFEKPRLLKPYVGSEIYSLTTPIAIQNFVELKDDASADRVAGAIADVIGISTYSFDKKYNPRLDSIREKYSTGDTKSDRLESIRKKYQ